MGRWRDGTPLVLSPDRPDPATAERDFSYRDDREGRRCPFAAHVRIVNPRDQELDAGNRTMLPAGAPRVLRRGTPYGPELAGEVDDGQDRGIIGMFLCANINQQFYPLTRWMNKTNFSPVFTDVLRQDPLFANKGLPRASDEFEIPLRDGSVTLDGLQDFVRTQGTLLLLLPSMRALARLAGDA